MTAIAITAIICATVLAAGYIVYRIRLIDLKIAEKEEQPSPFVKWLIGSGRKEETKHDEQKQD